MSEMKSTITTHALFQDLVARLKRDKNNNGLQKCISCNGSPGSESITYQNIFNKAKDNCFEDK